MIKVNQNLFWKWIPPILITLLLGIFYALTMAPGLSWANNGADGGDLISAAYMGGVAHPSGYPTYLILARLFQILPFGTLAFRTNLMSAIFLVLACILLYRIVTKVTIVLGNEKRAWLAGTLAALAFGWSGLAWSQAVITEVYTLHCFFFCLILFLLQIRENSFGDKKKKTIDRYLGLVLGLALGNQITIIVLLPIVVLVGVVNKKNVQDGDTRKNFFHPKYWQFNLHTLIRRLGWLTIGLSIYITLPLRVLSSSPVNWGNPVSFKGFLWLISGQIYQSYVSILSPQVFTSLLEQGANLILSQLGLIGLMVALFGIVAWRPISKKFFIISGWLAGVFFFFFLVYHTNDSTVYLLPVNLVLVFWFGLGSYKIIEIFSNRSMITGITTGILLFGYLVWVAFNTFPNVDASKNLQADQFKQELFQTAPLGALVITSEDRDSFALWYYHFALEERPDLRILVSGLSQFDWYRNTLHETYPDINIPDKLIDNWTQTIILSNPDRALCYTFLIDPWLIHCNAPLSSN